MALTATNPVFDGEDSATVTATVMNLGPEATNAPGANTVEFSYDTTDRSLTGSAQSTQTFNSTEPLPPGATVNVSVQWSPAEDQIGNGTLIAVVDSSSEPDSATGNNRLETPVFVRHHNATLDQVDTEERTAFPGQATPYRVTLTNTGNTPTTYSLNLTQPPEDDDPDTPPPDLPNGWNGTVHPDNATLAPGETRTLVGLVSPPLNAEEGDRVNTTIQATARVPALHNVTVDLPRTTVATELPAGFEKGLTLDALTTSSFAGPEPGNQTVAFAVNNTGTLPDAYTFNVTLTGDLADKINVTPPPVTALNASQATVVNATVHVLDRLPVGQDATLTVEARSVNADVTEPPTTAEHRLIASGPNLVVTHVDPPEPTYAAQGNLTIPVTVANHANLPAPATNLTLDATRSGFTATQATAPVPAIAPGENATIQVPFDVSDLAGLYTLVATANQPSAFNETNATDNLAHGDLEVRTTGLSVDPAEALTLRPDAFARYVNPPHLFEVANTGNTAETVTVTVESDEGWFPTATRTLTVEAGTRAGIPVEFRVPVFPGVPRDTITVTAQLANASDVRASNQTQAIILDEDPPEPVDIQVPGQVEATVPFQVNATFRDAVGVGEAWITTQDPEGGQDRVTMTPAGNGTFTTNATFQTLGESQITVHASDRSGNNNTYNDPDPRPVTVAYDRRPTIDVIAPTSGALRSGDPIRLDIQDRAGFKHINATVQGETLDLEGDQSIDTTGWVEGTYEIQVTAVNRFDLSNSTTLEVTIDNTPPEVQEVAITPSDPSPGDEVTIETVVQGQPVNVTASIQGDQGSGRELNMTLAEGIYTATTTLPGGTFEVTVLAVDAAGNLGSLDQPRILEVSNNAPTPWIAPLVAILVAAFATTARRQPP